MNSSDTDAVATDQRRQPRRGRAWWQRTIIVMNMMMIFAAVLSAGVLHMGRTRVERLERVQLTGSLTEIESNEAGDRVLNILLVGYDSSAGLDPNDPINIGRDNEQNSDVIIIAHLDERDGSAALLSIPRDLYVPISGTNRSHRINTSFATGGPAMLIDTIEDNFGIPIHSYVQVDFAGFQGIVEAVGSVEVFFPAPARDWNANFNRTQTGFEQLEMGCVALGPEQALAYVRSRYYQTMNADLQWVTDPSSDFGRIKRQQDFLKRLLDQAIAKGARNPFVLNDLINSALDSVTVDQDINPQFLLDLALTYNSFEPSELATYSMPADYGTVGQMSVLFTRDAQAQPILELFRGAPSDDPATVLLSIVHSAQRSADADTLQELLSSQGYSVSIRSSNQLAEGTELRVNSDGAGAGQLVYETLEAMTDLSSTDVDPSTIAIVVDDQLTGREVLISLGDVPETLAVAPTTTVGPGSTMDEPVEGSSTTVDPSADLSWLESLDTSCL